MRAAPPTAAAPPNRGAGGLQGVLGRVVLGIAAGVAIYVAFSLWADARAVGQALRQFAWLSLVWACLLAAGNYALRFARWEYYLRHLGVRVAPGDSLLIFLAGFALTVTPGKLGEAIKALLLRQSHGVPAARTAPIVVAERVTDLLALLLLALVGVFTFAVDRRFLAAGGVLVGAGIAFVGSERLVGKALAMVERTRALARFAPKLREFHAATAALLRPGPLLVATVLSLLSWFLECVAFHVVVHGFPGAAVSLRAAVFIYAAMTVAGALSFLPGGLGVTEAGMLALLVALGSGIDRPTAAAATFVTRVSTLWFAVALGLPALLAFTRKTRLPRDTT